MDLSNLTYQPVNLAGNLAQGFQAGASAVPDLSARVTQLLERTMAEEGSMSRTRLQERGLMSRERLAQSSQDKRSMIAAGYGPAGQGLTMEDMIRARERLPGTATLKGRLASGEEISMPGAKFTDDELLDNRAYKAAESVMKASPSFAMAVESDPTLYTNFVATVRARLAAGDTTPTDTTDDANKRGSSNWPTFASLAGNVASFLNNPLGAGAGMAAGNRQSSAYQTTQRGTKYRII